VKIESLAVAAILAFAFAGVASGQIPSSPSAGNASTEIPVTDERVDQVIKRANDHFTKGKLNLEDNKREQARDEFDKAIDEILMSGLDVRSSRRLETAYLILVESIYREEVPLMRRSSEREPRIEVQTGFREQPAKQGPCTVGIDKVPAIRGLRLGMTISEVKALYSGISEPNNRDEVGRSMVMIRGAQDNDRLKGIDYLFLSLFNGKVFSMSVSFKEQSNSEVDDLVRALSLTKNGDYATAYCEGFNASIFRHSDSQTLDLMDTLALNKIVILSNEMKENSADCQSAPTVRGIGLGMALTKFKSLYPGSQELKRSEVGELVLHSISTGNARLSVTDLWLYFLDGKLYFFAIDYSNQIQWKSIDQFVEQFSKGVRLRTKWEGAEFSDSRTLLCHSIAVVASMKDGHPRIAIQDRAAAANLTKREERSKSPSSFRP
jgi:hypothetical protein